MSLVELGTIASAIIAIITLITKLFNLIAAIQQLISRLDFLQSELNRQHSNLQRLFKLYDDHEKRMIMMEQLQKRGYSNAA